MLRYFVSKEAQGHDSTPTDACIVQTAWSDLPHSHNQAVITTSSLMAKGLLFSPVPGKHKPTEAGIALIKRADQAKLWQAPPAPSITNNPVHIDPVVKDKKKEK